jgi:hypothetical protein
MGEPSLYVEDPVAVYESLRRQVTHGITVEENPFEGDFSIWYLAVDLYQMPKLAKDLLRFLTLLKKFKKPAGAKTLKQIADAHLAVSFGLVPTLDDFREFFRIVSTWGLKYSELNKRLNRGFTGHGEIINLIPPRAVLASGIAHLFGIDIPVDLLIRQNTGKLFMTYKYYFVCPELSGVLNRLKQFVDQMGILDPAAIWDVIPFSFLVDWLYPVGTWLHHNLKPTLLPADLCICDWCESIGKQFTIDAAIRGVPIIRDSSVQDAPLKDRVLARGSGKLYARRRQFPKPLVIKRAKLAKIRSVVTVRRIFLGAALLTQRRRVPPRYGQRFRA